VSPPADKQHFATLADFVSLMGSCHWPVIREKSLSPVFNEVV
jgi:hypothetical protein